LATGSALDQLAATWGGGVSREPGEGTQAVLSELETDPEYQRLFEAAAKPALKTKTQASLSKPEPKSAWERLLAADDLC
jgi:hypothetical protein